MDCPENAGRLELGVQRDALQCYYDAGMGGVRKKLKFRQTQQRFFFKFRNGYIFRPKKTIIRRPLQILEIRYNTLQIILFFVGSHITYQGYKSKVVPLQAWSGPKGSRKLRFPDFMITAQDGGKVVSLTQRPPLLPGNTPGNHFC